MAITAEAPRGGVVEYIGSASYAFVLRIGEIERFEDKHRGIFDVWDGFYRGGQKATMAEVKDLVALALVGGGKKDHEADKIVSNCTPADLLRLYAIAQAALGAAFMPDALDAAKSKKKPKATSESALTQEG